MTLLQMYVPVDCNKHPLSIENTKRLIPSPGSQDYTCRTLQRPETEGSCGMFPDHMSSLCHGASIEECVLGFAYLYEALLLRCAAPMEGEGGNRTRMGSLLLDVQLWS